MGGYLFWMVWLCHWATFWYGTRIHFQRDCLEFCYDWEVDWYNILSQCKGISARNYCVLSIPLHLLSGVYVVTTNWMNIDFNETANRFTIIHFNWWTSANHFLPNFSFYPSPHTHTQSIQWADRQSIRKMHSHHEWTRQNNKKTSDSKKKKTKSVLIGCRKTSMWTTQYASVWCKCLRLALHYIEQHMAHSIPICKFCLWISNKIHYTSILRCVIKPRTMCQTNTVDTGEYER